MATHRIAIDVRPLQQPKTGIGRYLKSILPLLLETEHEWFLYSDRCTNLDSLVGNYVLRTGNINSSLIGAIFAQLQFSLWAKRDHIDLFWSPRHHLPLALDRIPSIVTVHDLVWREMPETMTVSGRFAESVLMPSAIKRSYRIIVPSVATGHLVSKYYPVAASKIRVTPLASSLMSLESTTPFPHKAPYLLFVGTIEPRKNLARILDAFETVISKSEYPHDLVIAGGLGWKNSDVMARLSNPALKGRVIYLGNVDDDTLASLYRGAYFVVAPSLSEGFGLPLVEALSYSKPILTSNCSSMPEVAGAAALLVDPNSIKSICAGMLRLLEDSELHRKLTGHAKLESNRFSWGRTAEGTMEAIEQVLEQTAA